MGDKFGSVARLQAFRKGPVCFLGSMLRRNSHPELVLVEALGELAETAVEKMVTRWKQGAPVAARAGDFGRTLRPGRHTPLWNELRVALRAELKVRGHPARLARMLGVPRQRVHAFLTSGTRMPDAERTLELLAWLADVRRRRLSPNR